MAKYKQGRFHPDEENFIKANCDFITIEEMSRKLRRKPETIKKFIYDNNLIDKDEVEADEIYNRLKGRLHGRYDWEITKSQLVQTDKIDEVKFFEEKWVAMIQQFAENVTSTEEDQIQQYIRHLVLINRNMADRTGHIKETYRLEGIVEKLRGLPEDELDKDKLNELEAALAFARASVDGYDRSYKDLNEALGKIQQQLKATRDQRFKQIESDKMTWKDLLKMFQDQKTRELKGREAELHAMAAVKQKEKMQEYYTYLDGEVDRPFLNHESHEKQ